MNFNCIRHSIVYFTNLFSLMQVTFKPFERCFSYSGVERDLPGVERDQPYRMPF